MMLISTTMLMLTFTVGTATHPHDFIKLAKNGVCELIKLGRNPAQYYDQNPLLGLKTGYRKEDLKFRTQILYKGISTPTQIWVNYIESEDGEHHIYIEVVSTTSWKIRYTFISPNYPGGVCSKECGGTKIPNGMKCKCEANWKYNNNKQGKMPRVIASESYQYDEFDLIKSCKYFSSPSEAELEKSRAVGKQIKAEQIRSEKRKAEQRAESAARRQKHEDEQKEKKRLLEQWKCGVCTFSNDRPRTNCEMCKRPKGVWMCKESGCGHFHEGKDKLFAFCGKCNVQRKIGNGRRLIQRLIRAQLL